MYVIYLQGKLSDQGKPNTEFYMEEDDFNAMIKVIGEPTYEVLSKNSGNLNSAPERVVACPSAARCG